MIKLISKQYILNKALLDSWQLAKYVSILHSHPATIKGDFGLQKELELLIQRDLDRNVYKFDHLVKLSDHIFANNIGSNDMQGKIEKLIIKKLKDRIRIDMTRFIKLVENLASYKIKNKEICDCILGFLMENLKYKSQENLNIYPDMDNDETNNMVEGEEDLEINSDVQEKSVTLNIER